MKKIILLIMSLLLITCENPIKEESKTTSWVFVANEGNYGTSEGSVSMIDDFGNVYETEAIGDVVQSIEVYENKLIVLVNNSHVIKIYEISEDGLSMPGIEIFTNNSSPRDLEIVNNKIYFTNWNSQDVKVFDLFSYTMEASIPIEGLPEDIKYDGQYLWVTIPHSEGIDFSPGSTVCKIDPNTNSLIETIEIGTGPQGIALDNENVYISRTTYDENFNAFHGATKIDAAGNLITNEYGAGTPCGGAILKYQNTIYRSFDGGLSPMDSNLDLDIEHKFGNYDQSLIYHMEEINGNIWIALTSFIEDYNQIKVIDSSGIEIASYQVGKFPGDFAFWTLND